MDQTRVTSGYDVEVAMGGRYLQYLLLLAVETGQFPIRAEFTPDGGGDAIQAEVLVPPSLDRTYTTDPGAPQPPAAPAEDAFAVEILPTHPLGADVRVNVWLRLTRGVQTADLNMNMYIGVVLVTAPDTDGIGLGSMTLKLELLDIDGALVSIAESNDPPLPKAELLARLQPLINRDLSMNDLGTGGRIGAIHMKKLPADAERGGTGLYINLVLRRSAGGQRARPRGDLAQNIIEPGADIHSNSSQHLAIRLRRCLPPHGDGPVHTPPGREEGRVPFDVVEIRARTIENADQLHVSVEASNSRLPARSQLHSALLRLRIRRRGRIMSGFGFDVQASILADILLGASHWPLCRCSASFGLVFAALKPGST